MASLSARSPRHPVFCAAALRFLTVFSHARGCQVDLTKYDMMAMEGADGSLAVSREALMVRLCFDSHFAWTGSGPRPGHR